MWHGGRGRACVGFGWLCSEFVAIRLRCSEAFSGVAIVRCFAQGVCFYEQTSLLSGTACIVGLHDF